MKFTLVFILFSISCLIPSKLIGQCNDGTINTLTASISSTTCGKGNDFGNTDACTSDYMTADDMVYMWTPNATGCVKLVLSNTESWTGIFVTSLCPSDPGATCLASNVNNGGNPQITVFNAVSGTTYFITISRYGDPGDPTYDCTSFDLNISYCGTCSDGIMNQDELATDCGGVCPACPTPTVQDCEGAIPVCQMTYAENNAYTGTGNYPNEIDDIISCLGSGEKNDVWYTFTVQTAGNVCFDIIPNTTLDDYDWGVYDVSSDPCSFIYSNSALEVSCNYDAASGTTGPNGDGGENDEPCIAVAVGETYAVNVSQFSPSTDGYTLDFTESTASIFDVSTPTFDGVITPIACGDTKLNFFFSENIDCSTIDDADFTLTGPGGPYVLSGVTGFNCAAGASYEDYFSATVSPAITSGNYSLCLIGGNNVISDLCGNQAPPQCYDFVIATVNASVTVTATASCGSCDGSASVNATNGNNPYTYIWTSGGTGTSVSNACAGINTVTVTDSNGCSAVASETITEAGTLSLTSNATSVACNGASDGAVNVTVTGSLYTFLWSNTATTEDISGLTAGVYSVTVSEGSCSVTASETITEPSALSITSDATSIACNGASDGAVNVTVTGGLSAYTFLWSNAATTEDISGLSTGAYSVTVSEGSCSIVGSETITEPSALSITASSTSVSCNGLDDGTANITVTGGLGSYTYLWSNAATTENIIGLSGGTYDVTVSDGSCFITISETVAEPAAISLVSGVTSVTCNGTSDGAINVTVTGVSSIYSYSWSNLATTEDLAGLSIGTYNVTVSDGNCFITATENIEEPSALSITSASTSITCNGMSDGTANITITGGLSNYSFLWSNFESTKDLSGLSQGTYDVTVMDGVCSVSASETIAEPAVLSVTSEAISVTCNGESNGAVNITVSGGTGAYTFLWFNSATTEDIFGLIADTYTGTISDGNCTTNVSETVSEPGAITISSTITNVACGASNGSIEINATGNGTAYAYSWSNAQTTKDITGLSAGTFFLTVTNNLGCETSFSGAVTNPLPITTITLGNNVSCNGGSDALASVVASGGLTPYTYLWENGSTITSNSNLTAGIHYVTVTDATPCIAIEMITITEPNSIVTSLSITNVMCFGESNGAVDLNVSGGTSPYIYSWSNGETTQDLSNVTASSYSVYVVDANNCDVNGNLLASNCIEIGSLLADACGSPEEDNEMIRFQVGSSPIDASSVTVTWPNLSWLGMCQNAATSMIVDNINATILAGGQLMEPTPMIPAYANVIVISSDNFDWTSHDWTALNYNLYVIFQCDGGRTTAHYKNYGTVGGGCANCDNDRTTTIDVGTCSDAATYIPSQLLNGGNGDGATFDFAGNPTYVNNGCIAPTTIASNPLTIAITQPAALALTEVTNIDVICNGESNGSAAVVASGGTTNYTYTWSNAQTLASVTGLAQATYVASVTDANGCMATVGITVNEPTVLSGTIACVSVTLVGGTDGSVSGTTSGGTSPYSYNWDVSGLTTSSVSGLSIGVVNATITDTKGCSVSDACTITEPTCNLTLSLNISPPTCNGASDGNVIATISGGVSNYGFVWSTSANTTNTETGLIVGTNYGVTIIDAVNCTVSESFTVTEPTVLSVTASITQEPLCNNSSDGIALAQAMGGTTPYTYLWSNLSTTAIVSGLSGTNYGVTVNDINNCTQTDVISLTPPSVLNSVITATDVDCNGSSSGAATITSTGGISPYTYNWGGGNTGNGVSNVEAGDYVVTTTDANSCIYVSTYTISEPSAISVSTTTTLAACGDTDGSATIIASGGITSYNFVWNDGQTTTTATGLGFGVYSVTVEDFSGCQKITTAGVNNPGFTVTITTVTSVTCNGSSDGAITVASSGGSTPYTYSWDNPPQSNTTGTITGLITGNYSISVSDIDLCMFTTTTFVSEPLPLTITSSVTNASCFGMSDGAINIMPSGGVSGYTYSWLTGETTQNLTGLGSNTYQLELQDVNGCQYNSGVFTITEPTALAITATSIDITCNGLSNGKGMITVTGGTTNYSYLWSNGETNGNATSLILGVNTITATDDNNCIVTGNVTISQPSALIVNTSVVNIGCSGNPTDGVGTVTTTGGTSPYSYLWNDGASQTTSVAANLVAGTYSVTVSDAKSCSVVSIVSISIDPGILVDITSSAISCFGGLDGVITVSPIGGSGPYTYYLNGIIQTNSTLDGLSTGNYLVSVSDVDGCSGSATATISEPTDLVVVENTIQPLCDVNESNSIITSSGATSPYSYLWSTGSTTSGVSALPGGQYSVVVSDLNGCTKNVTITINTISNLSITEVSVTNASCEGNSDGAISIIISGGNTPNTYLWSNSSTTKSIQGIAFGNYSITITDNNGCIKDSILEVEAPSVEADFNIDITGDYIPVEVKFSNASTGATVYNWSFGDGNSSMLENPSNNYTASGEYNVMLIAYTDAGKLCKDTAIKTLILDTEPSYLIPAVFSPNGDNQNDIFTINGINIKEIEGKIFNRWGIELFGWETIQGGWDGRSYAGEEVPEGVYFYVIVVKVETDAPKEFTGTVTLVR